MSGIKIFIFGSCVSRDPFGELTAIKPSIEIVDYYARTSLASVASKKPSFEIDCSHISSSFQRRMVERDIAKSFFDDLKNKDFDLLLIDFTDDRFCLMEFLDGSRITESEELGRLRRSRADLLPVNIKFIKPFSDDFFEIWSQGWYKLYNFLLETHQLHKLLINAILWSTIDSDGLLYENSIGINQANIFFKKLYCFLSDFVTAKQFILYADEDLVGDVNHHWGRAPFHFHKKFEKSCLQNILNYTDFKKS
jgi:hypothetical protein